jgi:hypothetical protein
MFLILLNTCLAVSLENTEEKVQGGDTPGLGGNRPKVYMHLPGNANKMNVILRTDFIENQNGVLLDLVKSDWTRSQTKIALPAVYNSFLFEQNLYYNHADNVNQYIIPFRFVKEALYHYGGYSTENKQSFFKLQPDGDKPEKTIYFTSIYHDWAMFSNPEEMSQKEIRNFAKSVAKKGGNARAEIITMKTELYNESDKYTVAKSDLEAMRQNNAETFDKFLLQKTDDINAKTAEIATLGEKRTNLNAEITSGSENVTKLEAEHRAAIKANEEKIAENKKVFDAAHADFAADAKKIQDAQKALSDEEAKNNTLKTKFESTQQKYEIEETKLQLEKNDLEAQLAEINLKLSGNAALILANSMVNTEAEVQRKAWEAAVFANQAAITAEAAKLQDLAAKQKKYNDDYQAELTKSNADAQKALQAQSNALDAEREKEKNTEQELKSVITEINTQNNQLNNLNQSKNNLTGLNRISVADQEAKVNTVKNNYNTKLEELITKLKTSLGKEGAAVNFANASKTSFNSNVFIELNKISPKTSYTENMRGDNAGKATKAKKRLMKKKK